MHHVLPKSYILQISQFSMNHTFAFQ